MILNIPPYQHVPGAIVHTSFLSNGKWWTAKIQQMPGEQSQCTKQGEPDFPRGFVPSQDES